MCVYKKAPSAILSNGQFAGSWDSVAGHQANLFADDPNANSIDKSVQFYTSHGVSPNKLVIGMPLYGRAFAGTDGIGAPYSGELYCRGSTNRAGVGEGSWEGGMWDYKVLPLGGSQEINDHRLGASYSYNP
jgi:chitinase